MKTGNALSHGYFKQFISSLNIYYKESSGICTPQSRHANRAHKVGVQLRTQNDSVNGRIGGDFTIIYV